MRSIHPRSFHMLNRSAILIMYSISSEYSFVKVCSEVADDHVRFSMVAALGVETF